MLITAASSVEEQHGRVRETVNGSSAMSSEGWVNVFGRSPERLQRETGGTAAVADALMEDDVTDQRYRGLAVGHPLREGPIHREPAVRARLPRARDGDQEADVAGVGPAAVRII